MKRKPKFETDEVWKSNWIEWTHFSENELDTLQKQLKNPSVIISYKKPINDKKSWLVENLTNKSNIGQYYIYY